MLETRNLFRTSCLRSTSTRAAMSWHSKRPSMMKIHESPTCKNTWKTRLMHMRKNLSCYVLSTNNKWRKSPRMLSSRGKRQHSKLRVKEMPLILWIKIYGAQHWTKSAILDKKWLRSKPSWLWNLKKSTWSPLVINNQLKTLNEKLFTKNLKNSVWLNKWSPSNNQSAMYRKSEIESKQLIRKRKRCKLLTRKRSMKSRLKERGELGRQISRTLIISQLTGQKSLNLTWMVPLSKLLNKIKSSTSKPNSLQTNLVWMALIQD